MHFRFEMLSSLLHEGIAMAAMAPMARMAVCYHNGGLSVRSNTGAFVKVSCLMFPGGQDGDLLGL